MRDDVGYVPFLGASVDPSRDSPNTQAVGAIVTVLGKTIDPVTGAVGIHRRGCQ